MTLEQRLHNLQVPQGSVDVVLDTDAFNEIDDQFAIAYLLGSQEKLNLQAIYAAPFYNEKSSGPKDGMEKSYEEVLKLLDLAEASHLKSLVYRGSEQFLKDEKTPAVSPAAQDLAQRAMNYTVEKPLYVVAIGAITNVASALLLNPAIAERMVLVWLGGNAHHSNDEPEFNMKQDIAAARVVMGSGVPFVQLPCSGVVTEFRISGPELDCWLVGKNPLADYLAKNTIAEAESYAKGKPWTRVIWDVTAVAWLLNENDRFMRSRKIPVHLPDYNNQYEEIPQEVQMEYVYQIKRDELMEDLIGKLIKE